MLSLKHSLKELDDQLLLHCNDFILAFFSSTQQHDDIHEKWTNYLNISQGELLEAICARLDSIIAAFFCRQVQYKHDLSIVNVPGLFGNINTPIYPYKMTGGLVLIMYDSEYIRQMLRETDALRFLLYDNISTLKVDREKFENDIGKKYQLDVEISSYLKMQTYADATQNSNDNDEAINMLIRPQALQLFAEQRQQHQQEDANILVENASVVSIFDTDRRWMPDIVPTNPTASSVHVNSRAKLESVLYNLLKTQRLNQNYNVNLMIFFIIQLSKMVDLYYTLETEKTQINNCLEIQVYIKSLMQAGTAVQLNKIQLQLKKPN